MTETTSVQSPKSEADIQEAIQAVMDPTANFEARSMPGAMRRAFGIVRKWQGIPDTVGDIEALEGNMISPDMIIMILTLFQQLFECLPNSPSSAKGRIRAYLSAKEMERAADTVRFHWMADRAMYRMGLPRESGDVKAIREAFIQDAGAMTDQQLIDLQREMLFVAI